MINNVYAISDVHIDYISNWDWCLALSNQEYQQDAILIAGDITHNLSKLEQFLTLLKSKFKEVLFVPGNHDLWIMKSDMYQDSIKKFHSILSMCDRIGVRTRPTKIGNTNPVWIVPMFSWYSEHLDTDLSTFGEPIEGWSDFYLCKWPDEVLNKEPRSLSCPNGTPENYFLSLNEPSLIQQYDAPVITFSHFLPRRDCLPSKERLNVKFLPKVAGTAKLDLQIRSIKSQLHVFGHTHINWDKSIAGVRYLQHSIKYPRERENLGPIYGHTDLDQMLIWKAW